MELGATLCRPVAPACQVCPVDRWCASAGRVAADRVAAGHRRPGVASRHRERAPGLRAHDAMAARAHRRAAARRGGRRLGAPPGGHRRARVGADRGGHRGAAAGRPAGDACRWRRAPTIDDTMSTTQQSAFGDFRAPVADPTTGIPLPAGDAAIFAPSADLELLLERWRDQAALPTMTAEEMRGADARAQRLGTPGDWLMEQAGCCRRRRREGPAGHRRAVAPRASAHPLRARQQRWRRARGGPAPGGSRHRLGGRPAGLGWPPVDAGRPRQLGAPGGPRRRPPRRDGSRQRRGPLPQRHRAGRARRRCAPGDRRARTAARTRPHRGRRGRACARASACRSSRSTRRRRSTSPAASRPTRSSGPTSPSPSTVPSPGSAAASGRVLAGRVLVAPIGIPVEADRR